MKLYAVTVCPFGAEGMELIGVWSSLEEAISKLDEYVDEDLEEEHNSKDSYWREYADETIGHIDVVLLNKWQWEGT